MAYELSAQQWHDVHLADQMWLSFDVPIDHNGCLLMPFRDFPVGTHQETVWHWIENQYDVSIAYLMGHHVHPVTGRKEDL